jgi:hypothetical protein
MSPIAPSLAHSLATSDPASWIHLPTLNVTVRNKPACLAALCSAPFLPHGLDVCQPTARFLDFVLERALQNGTCKRADVEVTAPPKGRTSLYNAAPDTFPSACTFTDEGCAQAVCGFQNSAVNGSDGWTCYSDPAIATAAVEGRWWFAGEGACRGKEVTCRDLGGKREWYRMLPESEWPSGTSSAGPSRGFSLLVASSAAAAILASL